MRRGAARAWLCGAQPESGLPGPEMSALGASRPGELGPQEHSGKPCPMDSHILAHILICSQCANCLVQRSGTLRPVEESSSASGYQFMSMLLIYTQVSFTTVFRTGGDGPGSVLTRRIKPSKLSGCTPP